MKSFELGDVVESELYGPSILYKVVCFFDRGNALACPNHQNVDPKPNCDDVHVEVIWKKHRSIAPAWPVGETATFNVANLNEPSNEMLVIALAAR